MTTSDLTSFLLGTVAGIILVIIILNIMPERIRPINEHLIAEGMAYYHPTTGDVVWIKPNN